MANTETIEYLPICPQLLTPNGWVLDGGCLGFGFACEMLSRGMRVLAVDPSPRIKAPVLANLTYRKVALVGRERRNIGWVKADDEEWSFTSDEVGKKTPARTVYQLMLEYDIQRLDIVKLNVEGAEYEILENWPGPIACQISVSFHDFIPGRNPKPEGYYQRMLAHLRQWYSAVRHEWTNKYQDGRPVGNYWGSLFVLTELLAADAARNNPET